ncbi:MAG: hypothetical protein INF16_14495 [Methylobacterium sp.]|nr:hypothetical protein [Methylobacterium sp.]
MNQQLKTCFVISPIGAESSETRIRSDQVFKHIISPSALECGYKTLRADQISEPGIISSQVIQKIVEEPLVIADLTEWNPNVFYELAIRHAIKKPIVQIIHKSEKIPFDVAASRTEHFDHKDLDSVQQAKEEIVRQIRASEKKPEDSENPISVAIELQSLKRSDNPLEKSYAEILGYLTEIKGFLLDNVRENSKKFNINISAIEDLLVSYERLASLLESEHSDVPRKEHLESLQVAAARLSRPIEFICAELGMPVGYISPRMRRRRLKEE